MNRALILCVTGLCLATEAIAQSPQPNQTNALFGQGFVPKPLLPHEVEQGTNKPAIKEIAKGVYEIGSVRVDAAKRTVSFPVVLNMQEGPMEYLLVTTSGKVHESVFRTETQPFHIHTGMLLLGAKGSGAQQNFAIPQSAEPTYKPAPIEIKGDKIEIEFSWEEKEKKVTRNAAELLAPRPTTLDADGKPVIDKNAKIEVSWVYNGSAMFENRFVAQLTGSIMTLITDASALINNVAKSHENDDIWATAKEKLPPVGQIVTATIRLAEKAGK
ncbi:MAG TPA: YdjY domain-containing protein [Methylomirabilota bacterium]|nr:YdjY domain-containing protein [Methylomirabilota bacterium]